MLLAAGMVNAVRLMDCYRLRPYQRNRILLMEGGFCRSSGRVTKMYRVIAIVGASLALAACSSMPDWMSLDALKPAPTMDTVRFESVPPGAEARLSNEQVCRTPCALPLPANSTMTVTFTLNGYEPSTQKIEPTAVGTETPTLQPNPVVAELVPIPPPPKPVKPAKKKPVAKRKPVAKKPVAKKPATAATAPMQAEPVQPQQQQQAPWPAAPQPTR